MTEAESSPTDHVIDSSTENTHDDSAAGLSNVKTAIEKVEINTAGKDELAALPGISIILAKKIIKFRETKRPFTSLDDVAQALGLKPHIVERLQELVTVSATSAGSTIKQNLGRVVDF